jgi:hypothetical protein
MMSMRNHESNCFIMHCFCFAFPHIRVRLRRKNTHTYIYESMGVMVRDEAAKPALTVDYMQRSTCILSNKEVKDGCQEKSE